jgi:CDP-glucose 4,6-dehydratase
MMVAHLEDLLMVKRGTRICYIHVCSRTPGGATLLDVEVDSAQPDDGWEPTPLFWRDRRVGVTGATGFLGSHLVGMLVRAGAEVVILARDQVRVTPIQARWQNEVSGVRGHVEDQAILQRMFNEYEVETVFHLAAQTDAEVAEVDPASTFDSNVRGTWSVLEASRRSPCVRQVVVASSDSVYGAQPQRPYTEETALLATHPYDVSKVGADLLTTSYARTFGLPAAITRCANLFGPGDTNWKRLVPRTVRALVEGHRPIVVSGPRMSRDYLYVIDGALCYLQLAEALAERPELAGEAFNFSAERPLTVLEVVEMLQIAAGTHLEPDLRAPARDEVEHQFLSAAKARQILGWAPGHTVEEAMILTVQWYEEHLGRAAAGRREPAVP